MYKNFKGPWSQGRPTTGHVSTVIVSTQNTLPDGATLGLGPEDIFVGAGCQRGNLHVTTVVDLITALIEAVVERGIPSPRWQIQILRRDMPTEPASVFEVTSNGRIEMYRTNAGACMWNIFDGGHLITGPHSNERFFFRFAPVPQDERIREWIARLTPPEGR